ncbi:MAG: ribosome silencing factor [Proteobacteria bacterium]|nr:ribosome silencing factor [Pseudomonadota bacterium]MCG6936243.1 ribosome silencing factor [Pseudomonadota bacterium]
MNIEQLKQLVIEALEDVKGVDIRVFDVQDKSSVTDMMVVASGNTARQVKALADSVVEKAKQAGVRPLGMEGEQFGEWVLVDLGDLVVHIMQPSVRDFYNLEKLWGEDSPAAAHKK